VTAAATGWISAQVAAGAKTRGDLASLAFNDASLQTQVRDGVAAILYRGDVAQVLAAGGMALAGETVSKT